MLVDGACDSPHTAKAVDEAMARRRGVLEREEEAEKEKRRETRTLRDEARHALREQLAEQREAAGEEGEQLLPAEVSEVAVSLEVQKRQEALACGGQVEALSREALPSLLPPHLSFLHGRWRCCRARRCSRRSPTSRHRARAAN